MSCFLWMSKGNSLKRFISRSLFLGGGEETVGGGDWVWGQRSGCKLNKLNKIKQNKIKKFTPDEDVESYVEMITHVNIR